MSKSLKKLIPKDLRKAVAAIPLAGAALEAAGLVKVGGTVRVLRQVAGGLTAAGLVVETAITVSESLGKDGIKVDIDLSRLLEG